MEAKKRKLNKAISDSLTALINDGVNVNINITTDNLVRIGIFTVILAICIGGVTYAFKNIQTWTK